MQRLSLLGLNHTTAPLELREKLAFSTEQRKLAVQKFRDNFKDCELVLLSTCNRVELYTAREVHAQPRAEGIVQFLSEFHSVPAGAFEPHIYQKTDLAVVEHLFAVTSSLDSMVLGETQILGQVREAYDESHKLAAAGMSLNPLFQKAIAVGRQVMRDTKLAEGRLSIASVAVDYAKRIFDHFGDKSVLCIGAGKMTNLVLQSLAALQPGKLLICNRDQSKADALARQFKGQAVPFDQLVDHLATVDIVVSSTGSAHPIITREMFETVHKKRRRRPIFLIDIALPRDIEAGVSDLDNVYLYNLDDLQQVVSDTQAQRKEVVESARMIVAQQVEEFVQAHRARAMGPVIDSLYQRYHQIAQEELARTLSKLPNLTDGERTHLELLTRRIVNKLLHDPVQQLRQSDALHGPATQYLHAMEKLFKLSDDASGSKSDDSESA